MSIFSIGTETKKTKYLSGIKQAGDSMKTKNRDSMKMKNKDNMKMKNKRMMKPLPAMYEIQW